MFQHIRYLQYVRLCTVQKIERGAENSKFGGSDTHLPQSKMALRVGPQFTRKPISDQSTSLTISAFALIGCGVPITRTATRSCRTRKRAFHFDSPCVVRRSHTLRRGMCGHWPAAAASAAAAAAAGAAVYRQCDD